jgi:hypothetical protein
MIISKNGNNEIPSWMMQSVVGKDVPQRASAPGKIDDSNELSVMEGIQKAAVSGGNFYYDARMDADSVSKIKEMAEIVGLPSAKIQATDPSIAKSVEKVSIDTPKKVESREMVDVVKKGFADPESFVNNKSWDSASAIRHKTLSESPSMLSSVRSVRGGDDYNVSPNMKPRVGEASVVSPDVSGINDNTPSTKDLISSESELRKKSISFDKEAWETETTAGVDTASLPKTGIGGYGGDDTNRHWTPPIGQLSIMPGESQKENESRLDTSNAIRKENEARLNAIRRPREDGRSWDAQTSSVPNKVSDLFYESLKKAMGS